MEAVGTSCGYGTAERFARAFKQEIGMTPTQFRKYYRNENRRNLETAGDELEKLLNG